MAKIDYLIIANLMSGLGEASRKAEEVKRYLTINSKNYGCIEIREPRRISKIKWHKEVQISTAIVCIGGDGTVTETVGFIINNQLEKVPLAIIPTGTANILYNTLNLWTDGYDFLSQQKIKCISVGKAEYRHEIDYFTIGVGLGFSEKYISLTNKGLKKSLGSFAYVVTAIQGLLAIRPIPITFTINDESKTRKIVLLLVFNIHPVILKFFPLFPFSKGKQSDDKITIFYLRYRNKVQAIIGTLACHIFGRYNFHLIKKIRAEEISLSSSEPCPTQIDGELRGELPVKLTMYKEKIKLLV